MSFCRAVPASPPASQGSDRQGDKLQWRPPEWGFILFQVVLIPNSPQVLEEEMGREDSRRVVVKEKREEMLVKAKDREAVSTTAVSRAETHLPLDDNSQHSNVLFAERLM